MINTYFDNPITCSKFIFNAKKGHQLIPMIKILSNFTEDSHLSVKKVIIIGPAITNNNPIVKKVNKAVRSHTFK